MLYVTFYLENKKDTCKDVFKNKKTNGFFIKIEII